ncbi:MAG: hypothetical protein HKN07_11490 [Acidimicrobiia bacterium]|nr:hypothetical protein [Acidimicrobiia bacterium]
MHSIRLSVLQQVLAVSLAATFAVVGTTTPAHSQAREERDLRLCDRTSVGFVPLNDLGTGQHLGFEGGLYPGGSNEVPAEHLAAGMQFSANIVPRDANGEPSADGKIGLIAVGVSNAKNEFRRFTDVAPARYELNPDLVMVNGGQGGKPVEAWRRVESATWRTIDDLLVSAGITGSQVQAAWVMLPEIRVDGTFPDHAIAYQDELEQVLRTMYLKYPNIQIAYLSTRIYAGYGQGLSIEPFAYEMAFSTKWIIEKQINGVEGSVAGVDMPWLRWGPYTWADGLGPDGVPGGVPGRSDGLEWTCDEMSLDGIHPSGAGATKVAEMLADHFAADLTSKSWFLADPNSVDLPVTTTTTVGTAAEGATTTVTRAQAAPSTTRVPGGGAAAPRQERNDREAPGWPVVAALGAAAAVGIFAISRLRARRTPSTPPV